MVLIKRLVASLAGACLSMSGNAALASDPVMYQEITDNKPDVGVSTTVYLGDRMLEQRQGQWQECIIPKFTEEKSFGFGTRGIIKSGQPICKVNQGDKAEYRPHSYPNWFANGSWTGPFSLKFEIKAGNCRFHNGVKFDWHPCEQFDSSPFFVFRENSFQQTIEYAGRNGDILKFTYSEFADGYARQAFTREFQVDLSQGNVAAYKGAVIEIENATNSSITYKVVRNFQQ